MSKLFSWFFIAMAGLSLTGCGEVSEPVTDFSDRSVIYGWIDIDDVPGSHLAALTIRQLQPESPLPIALTAFLKLDGGYAFFTQVARPGIHRLGSVSTNGCLGRWCGSATNQYEIGLAAGGPPVVSTTRPGVYFIGNSALHLEQRFGFMVQGEFSVSEATNGPSRRQLLQFLLDNLANINPTQIARMQAELARL